MELTAGTNSIYQFVPTQCAFKISDVKKLLPVFHINWVINIDFQICSFGLVVKYSLNLLYTNT